MLAPAAIWVFWNGSTGWGIFLVVWTLIVGTMDNFLRPMLIKRGADLPLLLIFAGVIGGLLGFGLVGIFVGPVMLAVSYTLIDAWLYEADPSIPARPARIRTRSGQGAVVPALVAPRRVRAAAASAPGISSRSFVSTALI